MSFNEESKEEVFADTKGEDHSSSFSGVSPEKQQQQHHHEIDPTVGVRAVEIYSKQYDKFYYRVILFFSIFLVSYAYGLDGTIRYTYQSLATSAYAQHSLLATVNCIRGVVAAAGQIFFARMSDVFGRVTMVIIAILFYVVGTIIESQAYDVQRFTAGAIFYQVGYTGIMLLLEVILSDFSKLNERVLVSFIPLLPFIINTWISGDVTDLVNGRWSWGIGMWAFIFPLSCIPLLCCLIHMVYLAHRHGDLKQPLITSRGKNLFKFRKMSFGEFLNSTRKSYDFCVDVFFWKLDLIGLLLMVGIFGMILIPFTLAGSLLGEWRRARIIVPEVIGWCIIPLFVYWESKWARYPITPGHLLKDRGVWSAMIIGVFINFVWYMQGDYMYTVLIVAVRETIKSATRITSLYSFVSVLTGTGVGFVIVKVKRTKPFILFGIAMWMVSFGIMIYYRGDTGSHSGIIGGLCLMGFGAGFFTYVTQLSIQACTDHMHMAVVLSLYLASYNIGSSLGSAVSGAIWTNTLPKQLSRRLGQIGEADLAADLYGSPFTFIVTYTWNTPERVMMVELYKHVQKILCIVGLCLCIPLMIAAMFLRNYKMGEVQSYEIEDEKKKSEVPLLQDFKNMFSRKSTSSMKSDDDIVVDDEVVIASH